MNLLTELELEELSLVDNPANPLAMAPLFKMEMSPDKEDKIKAYMEEKSCSRNEAMKALGYMEKDMSEELQAQIDTLKAENERLRKALIEDGYVIKSDAIEKKAPVEEIEVEGVMVNKADIPAPVLKALEAAEAERQEVALEKKAAETLPHFDKEVAMAILKFDLDEKIMEALKAADAAFEAAMGEVGEAATEDMSDTQTKLDKMVEKVKSEKGFDYNKAYAVVAKTTEGKELINQLYKEKK